MDYILERQLTFLIWIAGYRTPLGNAILRVFNFFDTPQFFLFLIPFVWIGLSWRWGVRLFYFMILSGFINHLLKVSFAIPRPCFFIPDLALVPCSGYTFPSGGGQTAALLAGFVWMSCSALWARWVAIGFAVCMGASRFLLGVHYPTDVLAGYLVGITLVILFACGYTRCSEAVAKRPYLSLAICSCACLVLSFFSYPKGVLFWGSFLGASLTVFLSRMFSLSLPNPKSVSMAFFRGLSAVLLAWILYGLFPSFSTNQASAILFFEGFFVTLSVPLFANLLWKSIGSTRQG
ncbi:MAG: phosphatase PAP2 family protein [Chlamydiota bacterium]